MAEPRAAPEERGNGEGNGSGCENGDGRQPDTEPGAKKARGNTRQYSYIEEERDRVRNRVGCFKWSASAVWRSLENQFGPRLSQQELVSIATLVGSSIGIKLDRDARRRKCVLIKWFEEHWSAVGPILQYVVLRDNS